MKARKKGQGSADVIQIWGLPKRLKSKFKSRCAVHNLTMKQVLINFMRDFCD